MISIIDGICYLNSEDNDFIKAWLDDDFAMKLRNCADLFCIKKLPDDMRIIIHICDDIDSGVYWLDSYRNMKASAITADVREIYVQKPSFNSSTEVDLHMFKKQIIHECVHAFQAYYSLVLPNKYIWLYESIACFLADQYVKRDEVNNVSWDDFVNSFYLIDGCYAIAYSYGKTLFDSLGIKVLERIKQPQLYWNEFEKLYIGMWR